MNDLEYFKGKTYIITGGSSGIGKASSLLLAEKGASVISIGRTRSHLESVALLHKNIKIIQHDFSESGNIEHLVDKIKQFSCCIDGFVHCAGVIYTEPFETFRMHELRKMELVNVESGFELLQKVLVFMKEGSLVFVSSIDAFFGAINPPSSGYALSKAAVIGLVRALASELGDKKIRVNAVVPGLIKTQMTDNFFSESFAEERHKFLERVPLRRAGTPEEVARLVVFLLSDSASYITGDAIFIDGGYHVR